MAKTNVNWLDALLEASEEEVDEVIDKAINSDGDEMMSSSQATGDVKDADVKDDPDALVYDKTDCYSQDVEVGDENVAGEVDIDNDDTDTEVKSGPETDAVKESFTADELRSFYTEAVAEYIAEGKEEINAKYKAAVAKAKEKRDAELAKLKAKEAKKAGKDKAAAVAEAADINGMLADIFSKF